MFATISDPDLKFGEKVVTSDNPKVCSSNPDIGLFDVSNFLLIIFEENNRCKLGSLIDKVLIKGTH